MKRIFVISLLVFLLLAGSALAEGPLGQPVPDFTVQTIDGGTFTLSEALEQYDAVLINLFATWCGPCRAEFPFMQQAYDEYKDRVGLIALSVEPKDSPEVLRDYAAGLGLTLPMGLDVDLKLSAFTQSPYIPVSILVDRFGNAGFVEARSQTSKEAFTRLFDYFLDENYTETAPLSAIPAPRAQISLEGAAGGQLTFRPVNDPTVWTMTMQDGLLTATNGDQAGTDAAVEAIVNAQAGDALAFSFRTDVFPAMDHLFVTVDGQIVKRFSGQHDWTDWAIPLSAGEHVVGFGFHKGNYGSVGENNVWINNARLVSGLELPAQPVAERFDARLAEPAAQAIAFDDPDGFMTYYFGSDTAWIVNGDTARIRLSLTADNDPETVFAYLPAETMTADCFLLPEADGEGFLFTVPLPADGPVSVGVYPGPSDEDLNHPVILTLYPDENAVTDLIRQVKTYYDLDISWEYVQATYTVRFVDDQGAPVPGCIVNFCTDEMCLPVVADADGVASYTGAPYAYHLQVIKVPAGYTFDTAQEFYTEPAGGDMVLTVGKE